MTLADGKIGSYYRVKSLHLEEKTERHLEALGLLGGTKIKVLNCKKCGSVIFKVRGTRLAVGTKIAASIEILEVER